MDLFKIWKFNFNFLLEYKLHHRHAEISFDKNGIANIAEKINLQNFHVMEYYLKH